MGLLQQGDHIDVWGMREEVHSFDANRLVAVCCESVDVFDEGVWRTRDKDHERWTQRSDGVNGGPEPTSGRIEQDEVG